MSQQYKSDSLFDNWLQRYENMYATDICGIRLVVNVLIRIIV